MYKINVPGRGEITAPALLLTTTGRKSGDKFVLPLFYGTDGDSYFVVASKGARARTPWVVPQYPRYPGCRGAGRDQETEGAGEDCNRGRTHSALEEGARILAALRRLSAQDGTRDSGSRAGSYPLGGVCQFRRRGDITIFCSLWTRAEPCLQGFRGPASVDWRVRTVPRDTL